MTPCNIVLALLLTGFPCLNPVSTFILPLPVEIGTDIEFDMEISLPYTIIFPDAFGRRRRSMLTSVDLENEIETDTVYGITVAKLNSMFESVGIADTHCRNRLICKIHRDPSKYSPLSDIILQHLDARNVIQEVGDHIPNSYMQFWDAGHTGLNPNGNCTKLTEKCEKDPDDGIDWPLMNFLQAVKRVTKMKFK